MLSPQVTRARVLMARKRLLVQCRGWCGLSLNQSMGKGIVGVLERETCSFAWTINQRWALRSDTGVRP